MIIVEGKKAQSRMKSDEKSKHIEGKTTSREGQRAAERRKKCPASGAATNQVTFM